MKLKFQRFTRIIKHKTSRTAISTALQSSRTILTSLGMIVVGLVSWSIILLVNGVYQLLLSLLKIVNVTSFSFFYRKKRWNRQRTIRLTGAFTILLGLIYLGLNIYFYQVKPKDHSSFIAMLLTAFLSFIKLGSAIWSYISHRKSKDPEIITLQLLSLLDGLVAIVTTQRVILTYEKDRLIAAQSTPLLGIVVSVIFVLVGLRMMTKK